MILFASIRTTIRKRNTYIQMPDVRRIDKQLGFALVKHHQRVPMWLLELLRTAMMAGDETGQKFRLYEILARREDVINIHNTELSHYFLNTRISRTNIAITADKAALISDNNSGALMNTRYNDECRGLRFGWQLLSFSTTLARSIA